MSEPTADVPIEVRLAESMERFLSQSGCTKRSAVRLALSEAIHAGDLRPGDLLPSERDLADKLGVSLGTVQAAMQQLQLLGRIIRRRGDGTRVAPADLLPESTWHFRLRDPTTGNALRWGKAKVAIDRIDEAGDWSEFLGGSDGYIRIRRRFRLPPDRPTGADMYLRHDSAAALLRIDPVELAMVNIRPYLAARCNLQAVRATHEVVTATVSDVEAATFDLERGSTIFVISARAYGVDDRPIYFQRILVPAENCALCF
ncbi:GntR family transcriptional regulator [Acuticoccus sediminis]|nr:GntR family transcriptional regulator [Acuticoccus sediminis]